MGLLLSLNGMMEPIHFPLFSLFIKMEVLAWNIFFAKNQIKHKKTNKEQLGKES